MPLLISERTTTALEGVAASDPSMLVWWATEVECLGALARREREAGVTPQALAEAIERLDRFTSLWSEIPPGEQVRRTARRLVRTHPLRAADALQLAAALAGAEGQPETLELVTLDDRLADAARREGFVVVPTAGR